MFGSPLGEVILEIWPSLGQHSQTSGSDPNKCDQLLDSRVNRVIFSRDEVLVTC